MGLATGRRGETGERLDVGNGKVCAVLFGEGPGAGDRKGMCKVLSFVLVLLAPLGTDEELCASSPTFLRLASVLDVSLAF